jgi:hypothetical protein
MRKHSEGGSRWTKVPAIVFFEQGEVGSSGDQRMPSDVIDSGLRIAIGRMPIGRGQSPFQTNSRRAIIWRLEIVFILSNKRENDDRSRFLPPGCGRLSMLPSQRPHSRPRVRDRVGSKGPVRDNLGGWEDGGIGFGKGERRTPVIPAVVRELRVRPGGGNHCAGECRGYAGPQYRGAPGCPCAVGLEKRSDCPLICRPRSAKGRGHCVNSRRSSRRRATTGLKERDGATEEKKNGGGKKTSRSKEWRDR